MLDPHSPILQTLRERLADLRQDLRGPFVPELSYGRHFGPPAWNARQAAVVALLYPDGSAWRMPLTIRPHHLRDHAGQVSFPGGRLERGETPEAGGWREWNEELGPPGIGFHWLGRLRPLYVFNSNFVVTCCVAAADRRPEITMNTDEVAGVLEPSLDELANPECRGNHVIRRGGVCFRAAHMQIGPYRIWGATAILIHQIQQLWSNHPVARPIPAAGRPAQDHSAT